MYLQIVSNFPSKKVPFLIVSPVSKNLKKLTCFVGSCLNLYLTNASLNQRNNFSLDMIVKIFIRLSLKVYVILKIFWLYSFGVYLRFVNRDVIILYCFVGNIGFESIYG